LAGKLTEKRYMTIVCYVRSLNHPTSGMGGFFPTRTCGMLLRSTLFAVLTIATLSAYSQQFPIDTCSLGCPPTLDFAPADLDISCDAVLPAFDAVSATACAESPVEAEIGLELTKSSGTSCITETALGLGDDWALWFAGFQAQGYGASDNFIPSDGGLVFEQYDNGTALLSGEVRNDVNPAQGFEVRIFLQFAQDFDAWTAQGRLYKDVLGSMNYPDWTYYEMVDTLSHLIGLDDMDGDVLYLDHMPVHRLFGFQVGEGANNRNANHGVSGWFFYRGVIGGQAVSGTGDVNADLTGCAPLGVSCPVVERTQRVRFSRGSCGHDYAVQTIDRVDMSAPVFDVVPPLVVTNCSSLPAVQDLADFVVSDDCSGAGEISLEYVGDSVIGEPCNQILYRTWRATDACGNVADSVQMAAILDTIGPVISEVPSDVQLDCGDALPTDMPTALDACSENVNFTLTFDSIPGDCDGELLVIRTFTATDDCGNSSTASQTLTLVDQTAPEFSSVPGDTTIGCGTALPDDMAEALDFCSDVSMTSVVDSVAGGCNGAWIVTRTFTATDACGNSSSAQQTVSVIDTVAPVFEDFLALVSVPCGTEDSLMAAASDACGSVIDITWVDAVADTGCVLPVGAWTRTYTATDACGNSANMDQLVMLTDDESPTFSSVPADTVIACGQELPEEFATAEDNCSDATVALEIVSTPDSCDGALIVERIFTATDNCGNQAIAVQIVQVTDTVAPTFEWVPTDTTIACMAALPTDSAMAMDICSGVELVIAIDSLQGDCPSEWMVTRTFTATDACGNSASSQQVVSVIDTVAPVFDLTSLPADTLLDCASDIPTCENYAVFATDNCGTATVNCSSETTPGACIGDYTTTLTFTATDVCGNQSAYNMSITVVDVTAPVCTVCPADTTVSCEAVPDPADPATFTLEDDCGTIEIELVQNDTTGTPCDYYVTRVWTFTDDCGNTSDHTQTLTVEDLTPPQIPAGLPALDYDCVFEVPRDTLAIVDTLVYSDNCTDFTEIMVSYEDLLVSGDSTSNEFVLERIWTYTDQCGNVSMTTQEIVVDEPDANPELPSGLTPNGDGFNDTYYIAEIGPDPIHPPCYWADNVFTVFNRWGSLILEAPGYRNNWEGRTELGQDGEALPDGTYYVVFQVGLREFATFVDVRTQ
jgi:gliding motility-associated-like protein